jgi:hypothetical protein
VGVTNLTPGQERKRKSIAVGICLLSSVVALVAWNYGERPWLALGLLAGVWNFTADWLGGRLWLLHKSFGQIYQTTRETAGGIFWLPPLANTISRVAMILSMASLATCVFGPWRDGDKQADAASRLGAFAPRSRWPPGCVDSDCPMAEPDARAQVTTARTVTLPTARSFLGCG